MDAFGMSKVVLVVGMTRTESGLALTGFEARVRLVDHVDATLAAHDLAVRVALL
jgi:hypothetical protein